MNTLLQALFPELVLITSACVLMLMGAQMLTERTKQRLKELSVTDPLTGVLALVTDVLLFGRITWQMMKEGFGGAEPFRMQATTLAQYMLFAATPCT